MMHSIRRVLPVWCIALMIMGCSKVAPIDLDAPYKPIKEFQPAAEAIINAEEEGGAYDLEKTIQVMNGLEAAQYQSEDFRSYLEYMAKQDYEGVAPEVLRAKAKLLPIMQRMYELEQQHEEMDDMWMLARCAATGANEFVKNADVVSFATMAASGTLSPLVLLATEHNNIDESKMAAFSAYEKQMKLKGDLEDEIENIKDAYIEYLTEYGPVYHKYMKEWDQLCVNKDKAYLDIYSGRIEDGDLSASQILKKYPDNREALLLKAITMVSIGSAKAKLPEAQIRLTPLNEDGMPDSTAAPTMMNKYFAHATKLLDHYTELYPDRTAPALVVRARMEFAQGNDARGISYLDQAAIEYPRQAEKLTDLMDSYKNRSYLNKTPEGQYLLRLYRSTMEGYGLFSPNLQKAAYYQNKGDLESASKEVYSHFFRRGNQGIYDCLLSDMEFCENSLKPSFSQLLIEHAYIDVNIEPETDWKFQDKEDEIEVEINNRTDLDLENVRVFLCIHYTDMYTNEYDVVKTPSVSKVPHNKKTEIGNVKLEYEGKGYSDITRYRAIVLTDDKICWVDDHEYKINHAAESAAAQKTGKGKKQVEERRRELATSGLTIDRIKSLITGVNVYGGPGKEEKSAWESMTTSSEPEKLRVELPRILTMLDPIFSVYELQGKKTLMPEENIVTGTNIYLKFDIKPKKGDTLPLYMYSDYINMKMTITFPEGTAKVSKIEVI